MVISTVVCIPTLWLIKLSDASFLTILGFCSTLLIIFTLVFVRAYDGELDDVDMGNIVGPNVPLSMGIFVISLAGHTTLPSIYKEMRKPEEMDWVLNICFIIMFIVYAGAGCVGYMIYGENVSVIISTNLVRNPGGVLAKITAVLTITKNYFTMNPLVTVLCNGTEIMMGIKEKPFNQRIYRTLMFIIAALVAFFTQDMLPFLEGLTGGVSIMITTFILPAILFYCLHKKNLTTLSKLTTVFILVFGCIMMALLTFGAGLSLVRRK